MKIANNIRAMNCLTRKIQAVKDAESKLKDPGLTPDEAFNILWNLGHQLMHSLEQHRIPSSEKQKSPVWLIRKYDKETEGDFRCDDCDRQAHCDEDFGEKGKRCMLTDEQVYESPELREERKKLYPY